MTVDCRLFVGGTRFADRAAQLAAGTPTALADLAVTWGRGTTVDQPEAATCRFVVADRSGGTTVLDAVDVGAAVDVRASGDVSTGSAVETMADGGWEAMPVGPAGDRVRVSPTPARGTAAVVTATPHTGVHALRVDPTAAGDTVGVWIPPQPFDYANPAAWDDVPQAAVGAVWNWSAWVRAPRGSVLVKAAYFDGPAFGAAQTGPWAVATADGTWRQVSGAVTVAAVYPTQWLGLHVTAPVSAWADLAGTWQATPGAWTDYNAVAVDDVSMMTPPDVVIIRDVLVFSGRVTDLAAQIERDGTLRVEATAVDQLADLQNRYVGDTPWSSETVAARFAAIITASGADVDTRLDPPLDALMVSRRDVDNQPAGGLLAELAQGVDGVLWSATHATVGPYLWLENVADRAAVGTLTLSGGVVVITTTPSGRAAGRTLLDGCDVAREPAKWVRDVTDVVTRVDATWFEQTIPDVTERSVRVVDGPAEGTYGVRRYGTTTPLTNAYDATNVATRVLARSRYDDWRVEGLEYDLGLTPPAAGEESASALDLLDGTIRLGRAVIVDDVAEWPGGDTVGLYLEGGVYQYDGAWTLGLVGSPYAGMGQTGDWSTLDPTWRWNQMAPEIAWVDLWGVTGPISKGV